MANVTFDVDISDHGLAQALSVLGSHGLRAAERKGISEHVKKVRAVARSEADFNQGSIRSRVSSKGGEPYGRVRITDYKLRFYAAGVAAGGTHERHTRKGANRGVEFGEPFMARTAAATDPLAARTVENAIMDAVRQAGLS